MLVFRHSVRRIVPALEHPALPAGPIAFVDIETTGLCWRHDQITVVGIVSKSRQGRKLEQFLVEDQDDEGEVVEAVADGLSRFAGVVVYNGVRFDLPFLRGRAWRFGVRFPSLEAWDLIDDARKLKRVGKVQDCRLQTVLRRFRISRSDSTNGADAAEAYEEWLATGDEAARDMLLDHNAEDVLLLPDLAERLQTIGTRHRSSTRRRAAV